MASDKANKKQEEFEYSAQGMLDNAPAKGGKASYLKLPDNPKFKMKFFLPKEDVDYSLDFLSTKAGPKANQGAEGTYVPGLYIFTHKGIGPNNETFICNFKQWGKRCAVCEVLQGRRNNGEDWNKRLKPLFPKNREICLVHNRAEPDSLYIWDESNSLFGDYLRSFLQKKRDYANYAHPTEGYTIELSGRKITSPNGAYVEFPTMIFEKRKEPLSTFLLSAVKSISLEGIPIMADYEKVRKALGMTGGAEPFEPGPADEVEIAADPEPEPEPEVLPEVEAETEVETEEEVEEEETVLPSKGDKVKHPTHGICTVLEVNDNGSLKIKSKEGKIFNKVAPTKVALM